MNSRSNSDKAVAYSHLFVLSWQPLSFFGPETEADTEQSTTLYRYPVKYVFTLPPLPPLLN
jgi:hypothetical protein